MKQLYIGGKKLVIDSETYFPFTYKVSDFENFNIIGSPASKTISVPRCPENDDIFGYIAEINRITYGENDDEIGVSFNQTKRVGYELYDDSLLVSEGIIQISDITPTEYQINLYDKLVDLIEQLSEEEYDGYLSSLDIYYNDSIYSKRISKENVRDLIIDNHTLIPTFNLKNFESQSEIYINDLNNNKAVVDAGVDFTPAKFNTYKNWELDYVMPLKSVINSINKKHNNILTYDPAIDSMLTNIHMNLGQPKVSTTLNTLQFDAIALDESKYVIKVYSGTQGNLDISNKLYNTSVVVEKYNGLHKVYLNGLKLFFSAVNPSTKVCYLNGAPVYVSDLTDGKFLGSVMADVSLTLTNSSGYIVARSKEVKIVSELYNGTSGNTEVYVDGFGNAAAIIVECGNYIFDVDFYSAIRNSDNLDLSLNVAFNYGVASTYNENVSILFWNYPSPSNVIMNYSTASTGEIGIQSYKIFRTGDILQGSTLFPKVPIRDFIISLVKSFNLGIKMLNGSIYLHKKEYVIDDKTPQIDEISSIEVNNYTFSKLKINNELVDSNLLGEYFDYNDKEYAEKIVNTQYTIKKNTKEVALPISTPLPVVDADYYAYSEFLNYSNGGYRKEMMGFTEGGNNIQFGFLKSNNNHIYVTDDTFFEAGIESTETSEEVSGEKWMLSNFAYKQDAYGNYIESADNEGYNFIKIQNWNTLVPYYYDIDGTMLESLEVNKPLYNFANIADSDYPEAVTLYNKYLKGIISDMYNVNTHIISVKMYIDDVIDIYKIINYRNTLYRIYEITEYDPTRKDVYDVKLIRVNSLDNYNLKDIILYRNVTVTLYEYALFSNDIGVYKDNIDGIYSTLYKKIDSTAKYEYGANIYPKNKIFEDYSGMIRLGQNQQIEIIKKAGVDAYLKVDNLDFWHWDGINDVLNTYNLPLILPINDEVGTTGDVVSDLLHTKLYVEPDTRKVKNLEVNNPVVQLSYSGTNTWRLSVTITYLLETYPGGIFNEDTRIKFNQLSYSYGSVSGYINFADIANSQYTYTGLYLIHTFTFDFYNEAALPTVDTDPPFLTIVGSNQLSAYTYRISLDGTFTDSVDAFDGRSYSTNFPIKLNPYFDIDNITTFTGNGTEPIFIYLDYLSYTYQFSSEPITQVGGG